MRNKRSRKLISILLTLSLLVTLLVPMVGTASAASTYSATRTATVKGGADRDLGSFLIQADAGALRQNDTLVIKFPKDYGIQASAIGYVYPGEDSSAGKDIVFSVPATYNNVDNAVYNAGAIYFSAATQGTGNTVGGVTYYDEVKLTMNTNATAGQSSYILVNLPAVYVPSGSGDIQLTFSASGGFSSGSLVIGKVVSGAVDLTIDSIETITSSGGAIGKLNISENVAGASEIATDSYKLTLPSGFKWSTPAAGTILTQQWGTAAARVDSISTDERTLQIDVYGAGTKTCWSFTPTITVDESTAKKGDVEISVTGRSSVNNSNFIAFKYADYGSTVGDGTSLDITAGRLDQKIGEFIVEESTPGTLVGGRTLTLKLPSTVKWHTYPNFEFVSGSIDFRTPGGNAGNTTTGTAIWARVDDSTIKATFDANSTKAAKIRFKDGRVNVAGDATVGPLAIEISGTAGLTGSVNVADIKAPVSVTAASTPNVKIGVAAQAIGDITLSEGFKEAMKLSGDKGIELVLPNGVSWTSVPKVEVTDGDGAVEPNDTRVLSDYSGYNNVLKMILKSESTKPTTIKVTGATVDVNRTVGEGDVTLEIKGQALTESRTVFTTVSTVAKCVVAKVVTPAPGDLKAKTVFKIGDTKYTYNGTEQTMDVAPYLKNDRTFMPIRYIAQALGVANNNLMWNANEQSAIIIKGDRVVKLAIGSTTMYINGVAITMDAAPEFVDPGRVMMPLGWLGQALGADLQWDAATQSVIVN